MLRRRSSHTARSQPNFVPGETERVTKHPQEQGLRLRLYVRRILNAVDVESGHHVVTDLALISVRSLDCAVPPASLQRSDWRNTPAAERARSSGPSRQVMQRFSMRQTIIGRSPSRDATRCAAEAIISRSILFQ
jgi:hypothetical protein